MHCPKFHDKTMEGKQRMELLFGGAAGIQAWKRPLIVRLSCSITDTISVSMESLDEGVPEVHDFEDDPYLMIKEHEAEAWSVTVDKKTTKKMSAKDIKRQDHIWGKSNVSFA